MADWTLTFDGYNLTGTVKCGCQWWVADNDAQPVLAKKTAGPDAEHAINFCRIHASAPALLAALEMLTVAAAERENTMGDVCRLLECKANLESATTHARAAIRQARKEE